jgi:hypothetical protein
MEANFQSCRVFELVDGRHTSTSTTGLSGAIRGFASEGKGGSSEMLVPLWKAVPKR